MQFSGAIRDPIHGYIRLTAAELRGLDCPEIQRLRGIAQLGLTERVYPGARHSRFEHALGALELVSRIFEEIRGRHGLDGVLTPLGLTGGLSEYEHLLSVARWVALVHDVGHAPFSHVTEGLLPGGRSHEQVSAALLERGPLGDALSRAGGALASDVRQVLAGHGADHPPLAFVDEVISGPVGADRMDYLLRDSAATGVSYGVFDLDRILHTLVPVDVGDRSGVRLGVEHGGVLAVEGLLWGRASMFQQVYYHRTRRILDRHLNDFLQGVLPEGTYPTDLDDYLQWDDHRVHEMLRQARRDPSDPGHTEARRILDREHHRMLSPELEAEDPGILRRWLAEWKETVRNEVPHAQPMDDLLLPPAETEDGRRLLVVPDRGDPVPLSEVSPLAGRLRSLPLGRLYVAHGVDRVPGFSPDA